MNRLTSLLPKPLLTAALCTSLSACVVVIDNTKEQNYQELKHSYAIHTATQLSIVDADNDLYIQGVDGLNKIRLAGKVYTNQGEELDISDIATFEQNNKKISLLFKHHHNGIKIKKIALEVPSHLALMLDNEGGDTWISQINNTLTVHNNQGDLSIKEIVGNLNVYDQHGDINISHVQGTTKISDKQGDIYARKFSGDLHINDKSGDISVYQIKGHLSIDDGKGDINIEQVSSFELINNDEGELTVSQTPKQIKQVKAQNSQTLLAGFGPSFSM